MRAGDDLDQGGFARPVFADEGVDLARMQVEGDAAQRLDARKRLRYPGDGEQAHGEGPNIGEPEGRVKKTKRTNPV